MLGPRWYFLGGIYITLLLALTGSVGLVALGLAGAVGLAIWAERTVDARYERARAAAEASGPEAEAQLLRRLDHAADHPLPGHLAFVAAGALALLLALLVAPQFGADGALSIPGRW